MISFSHAGVLATAFLIREAKLYPTKHLLDPTFKVAIFFSSVQAVDPVLLMESGTQKFLNASDGTLIRIPTAHIWGKDDVTWGTESKSVAGICDPEKRMIFIHSGGHEIPGAKAKSDLYGAVHSIRRTVDAAGIAQCA